MERVLGGGDEEDEEEEEEELEGGGEGTVVAQPSQAQEGVADGVRHDGALYGHEGGGINSSRRGYRVCFPLSFLFPFPYRCASFAPAVVICFLRFLLVRNRCPHKQIRRSPIGVFFFISDEKKMNKRHRVLRGRVRRG